MRGDAWLPRVCVNGFIVALTPVLAAIYSVHAKPALAEVKRLAALLSLADDDIMSTHTQMRAIDVHGCGATSMSVRVRFASLVRVSDVHSWL